MSTTGTTAFNLDVNDLIEEAFERCGLELRTGYDFRTARRSLNLLTIEWANRGINLWTIEEGQIVMNTGQPLYAIPANTVDLLDQVIRQQATTTNQTDINISRISESTYSTIPNKLTQGRPIQVWINRQSGQENPTTLTVAVATTIYDTTITLSSTAGLATTGFVRIGTELIAYSNITGNQLVNCWRGQNGTTPAIHTVGATITVVNQPCVNIWPAPNAPGDQYIFVYWRMRRMQDAGTGTSDQDIPFRFIPCMVAGLAFHLSMKLAGVDPMRIQALKMQYDELFQMAIDEDRDKAPARFVPRNLFYS